MIILSQAVETLSSQLLNLGSLETLQHHTENYT